MLVLQPSALLLVALSPATADPTNPPPIEIPALEASIQDAEGDAAADAPDEKWHGSATVGVDFNTGNTETLSIAAQIDAELRREKDRQTAGAFWNYGEQTTNNVDVITERKAGANYQYDYFFSDKTYYFATAGVQTDTLATLDLRWWAGPGVGHQFYEEEDWKLNGEFALVYFEEYYQNSASDVDAVAARIAHNIYKRISETTVFEQTGEYFQSLEDTQDAYARLDSRVKMTVTETIFAQLQWILQWDNTPAAGQERTDNQVLASVGWTF